MSLSSCVIPMAQHSAELHVPEPPVLELVTSHRTQPQTGPGDLAGRGSAPFSSLQCKQKPKRTKFQSSYSSPGTMAEGGGAGTVTCGGMGGSGMGHGSTCRALRDEGVDPCDNGFASMDTSTCTSICCIPGPRAQQCQPGSQWQLSHQVSPEQLQEGGRRVPRG